ncbi:MAG TPA: sialidase family protein [Blastocatellia bacterium]
MAGLDPVGFERTRLLDPKIFRMLSPSAQRVVLDHSGLLRQPASGTEPAAEVLASDTTFVPPALDQFVNNPALDTPEHYTQNETTVAGVGNNIIESFLDTSCLNTTGPDFCGYAYSTDGGQTFTHKDLPQQPNQETQGQGAVAVGPTGQFYYSGLLRKGQDFNMTAIGVATSVDGMTFSPMVDASTTADVTLANGVNDSPWIAVDTNASSRFLGNVYVAWTQFPALSGPVLNFFAESTDGGKSFSAPLIISNPSEFPEGTNIAIGPKGDINIAYWSSEGGIAFTRSTDGGHSFAEPRLILPLFLNGELYQMTGIGEVAVPRFPMMAIGPDDTIHIVFCDQPRFGRDRSDIHYVRSNNGGQTFTAPVRLNDDNTLTTQCLPSIAITPSGVIGVKWWDRRNDPIFDSLTDVYMTMSHDGGNTFGTNFRVSKQNFIFTPIEGVLTPSYHGEYDRMGVDGEDFLVCWSGEQRGGPDAYFAMVPSDTNPLAPDFTIASQKLFGSVVAGGTIDYPIGVNTVGGFTGDLTLNAFPETVTQVPGIAASAQPITAGPGQTGAVQITTDASTPPGTYLFTVTASGGGLTRGTAFWLDVISPSAPVLPPPLNISQSAGQSEPSHVQVDSAGTIHQLYYDDTDSVFFGDKVYYAKSSDGGASYSPGLQLSPDGEQSENGILTLDSAGNIFVAYQHEAYEAIYGNPGNSLGNIALTVSTDGGATFSTPVDISKGIASPALVGLDIDTAGEISFTFMSTASSGLTTVESVFSQDGGKTFATPRTISRGISNVTSVSEASDGTGNELLGFLGSPAGDPNKGRIYVCASYNGGRNFSPPSSISPVEDLISGPSVALGHDGMAYVAYSQLSGKPGVQLAIAAHGTSFGPSALVTPPDTSLLSLSPPALALDSNDNIFIAFNTAGIATFQSTTASPVGLIRSFDQGKSFSIPVLCTNAFSSSLSSIALEIAAGGTVALAWPDYLTGYSANMLLAFSTDGGVTFAPSINVSNGPGVCGYPSVASLPGGGWLLSYVSDGPENDEVFSALLSEPAPAASGFALISQSANVLRRMNQNLVLSVSRPGAFADPVTVSAPSILPEGISILPSQVATASTNAAFEIDVDKTVPPGPYSLTFIGADSSGRTSSAAITVNVVR